MASSKTQVSDSPTTGSTQGGGRDGHDRTPNVPQPVRVSFAVYHLHEPWEIPRTLPDAFILGYPSKRYNRALIGIAVRSAQSVVILGIALTLVLR
jgi:hypothetical protein